MIINFADATGGLFTDVASFLAASDAQRDLAFQRWAAFDAQIAATSGDKANEFFVDAQVGRAFLTPNCIGSKRRSTCVAIRTPT